SVILTFLCLFCTRSFIPDEHMVWCPEQLLQCVLAHIHYMPDHWRGNANKSETRDEVAQLFQYKAVGRTEHQGPSVHFAALQRVWHRGRKPDVHVPFHKNRQISLKPFHVCGRFQPENLLASVLAHPILTASGLQGRDHRFVPPSSAASAAASVLASLSTSHHAQPSRSRPHGLLPSSVYPETTMYRSDHTIINKYFKT
ncbi:hypothetical protein XENOCAPTIV_002777, partial [Xenoophorus captivus]